MNLKALKEKKNTLLAKADGIVKVAEAEVRGLYSDEKSQVDTLTSQIKEVNEAIKALESRSKEKEIKKEKVDTKMEKTKELRGLEQFIRRQDGEEVRALQTTAAGASVIPTNVEGMIVKKMEETSPVFEKAKKFASVNGTLKIAKETAFSNAGFVGEGVDVGELAISLGEVTLTQKRVGAAVSLSNQLIHDSAVDIVGYSTDLLARRTAKAVEKSVFLGVGGTEFAGIKGTAGVVGVNVSLTAVPADVFSIEKLMDVYNALHPEFLNGAGWYMSRAFFNKTAKLKDGNGHFYVQNGVVNGKPTYTLFGAEIIVSDQLEAGTVAAEVPCYFGNITEAYAVMVKKGLSMQHVVADTTQALRGSQLLVLDGYMDGAVYNTQAIVKAVIVA